MSKKIKVILTKRESQKDNITNVSPGYAFNYLIPKKLAEVATKGKLKHIQMFKNIKNKTLETYQIQTKTTLLNLEKIRKISIKKNIGENQQIFGRVNEKEIIYQIFNYTGHKLDKKQLDLPEIKQTGHYIITIHLSKQVNLNLKLYILPLNTRMIQ